MGLLLYFFNHLREVLNLGLLCSLKIGGRIAVVLKLFGRENVAKIFRVKMTFFYAEKENAFCVKKSPK